MTDAIQANGDAAASATDDAKDGLKQKAAQTVDQLKSTVGERATAARDWAADQGDVLRDTVQTKPFVSVGVSAGTAFAAGLVLGILLARN